MRTVTLALLSAFLHALWNALLKREPDKAVGGVAVVVLAELTAIVVAVVGIAAGHAPFPTTENITYSLLAGVFEGGYFVSLTIALDRAPLGVAYTVSRGGALLCVWPVSALWLGEPITFLAITGSAVVALGLAATSLDGKIAWRGLLPAFLCAVFIAGYQLAYKRALGGGASSAAVFALSLAVAVPINLVRLGVRRVAALGGVLRARPLSLLGMGAVCGGSFLIFLYALADSGAAAMLTLRNTSVVFAVLLGWAIGDRPTRRQIIGSVLVAAGAILLGFGR